MTPYVDGYVLPISKDKLTAYQAMASNAGKIWMKHGALAYYECVGDDLNPHFAEEHTDGGKMKLSAFPDIMKTGPDETVIFAFVIYESREDRDAVNAKVMADPEMAAGMGEDFEMPMDPSRMAYAGFRSIVHYEK
jgi:uncharacterized protein YbaA (DUF1428 family)